MRFSAKLLNRLNLGHGLGQFRLRFRDFELGGFVLHLFFGQLLRFESFGFVQVMPADSGIRKPLCLVQTQH